MGMDVRLYKTVNGQDDLNMLNRLNIYNIIYKEDFYEFSDEIEVLNRLCTIVNINIKNGKVTGINLSN